jgi:hypothetical protein
MLSPSPGWKNVVVENKQKMTNDTEVCSESSDTTTNNNNNNNNLLVEFQVHSFGCVH